ncbi:MAG TPA: futalosine hydrolase [Chitinophagaceae bacterium]|nr:futalosine hydrolase [Chitinophagaceae bacterium]HNH67555.1 futalosine hydrolase [Bacteroidia bacterium]HNA90990.1 futalosine hydrolase [Chitinophagaceae bacterium]HND95253.1 futalosine hydrolase [Chitinophagaceae bacterium]HNK61093.1 futalosine hydrolase [Chitinophagaceae bacterium]
MNCLVIAATPIEIAPFLTYLKKEKKFKYEIDVLITGIGLTATTYALLNQINIKKPAFIIQAGVGGCFDINIKLGTVVAIKKETIADQSVVELKTLKTLFDLKLLPQNKNPFSNGWLVNSNDILRKIKLRKVTGISVNEITTDKKKVKLYRDRFKPVIESMEGAALHYVSLMEKIPFLQIRSVSNYIAERNKQKWNMKEAVENLNKELISILIQLNPTF